MNDTEKLQKILNNIINKCNGVNFYHVEVNGQTAIHYRKGSVMYLELENSGEIICVNHIHSVNFDDDVHFATFKVGEDDFHEYGLNITKDMPSQQIFEELCADISK